MNSKVFAELWEDVGREQLQRDYFESGNSARKVGKKYDVSQMAVLRRMRKYGILRQITIRKKPSKKQLEEDYEESRSTYKIGRKYDVHPVTVLNWMKDYGIERKMSYSPRNTKDPGKERLEADYSELRSTIKVGEKYKVTNVTIVNWMKKYGIERLKNNYDCHKKKIPEREFLEKDYEELRSIERVGEKYNVSKKTTSNWFKYYGIETRRRMKEDSGGIISKINKKNTSHRDNNIIRNDDETDTYYPKKTKIKRKSLEEMYRIKHELEIIKKREENLKVKKIFESIIVKKIPSRENLKEDCMKLKNVLELSRKYEVNEYTMARWLTGYGLNAKGLSELEKEIMGEEL